MVGDAAAAHLEALVDDRNALSDRDHADVVQAYGRLTANSASTEPVALAGGPVLARALGDESAAVRLAAASGQGAA